VTLASILLILGAALCALGSRLVLREAWRVAAAAPGWLIAREVVASLSPGVLVTVLAATAQDETSVAAATAFGAVAFLFASVFGGALVASRRALPAPPPIILLFPGGVLVAAAVTVNDLVVTRAEGLGLVGVFAVYLVVAATAEPSRLHGALDHARPAPRGRASSIIGVTVGLGLLGAAAALLLTGTARILDRTTLMAGFVGATLVAGATSLREAVQNRRIPDGPFRALAPLAAGIVGIAALLRPLVVDAVAASALLTAALLYAVVCGVFLIRGQAWRMTGGLVLGLYGAWLYLAATS
jgi:Ca2+/Na+ antiporter